MRTLLVLGCLIGVTLCMAPSAHADIFTFQPTPANLWNLDHGKAYTWGLDWTAPEGQVITGAYLFFDDINDWTVESGDLLYIHLLDDPPVGAVFGFHVWPENAVGTVLVAPGNVTAAADTFVITVKGKGAHAARPHEGVDAVVIASEIVTALQTIVSRAADPTDPTVVTVGTIHGGARRNIIADRVVLEGTVRTLS